jgi:hypothetical protein
MTWLMMYLKNWIINNHKVFQLVNDNHDGLFIFQKMNNNPESNASSTKQVVKDTNILKIHNPFKQSKRSFSTGA